MATRVDNTMVEWLQKMLKNIAEAKLLPDADMAFLVELENTILTKAKQPVEEMRQQGVLPPAQGGGAPSYGGVMGSPPMPNSDEMMRMLGPGQGPQ